MVGLGTRAGEHMPAPSGANTQNVSNFPGYTSSWTSSTSRWISTSSGSPSPSRSRPSTTARSEAQGIGGSRQRPAAGSHHGRSGVLDRAAASAGPRPGAYRPWPGRAPPAIAATITAAAPTRARAFTAMTAALLLRPAGHPAHVLHAAHALGVFHVREVQPVGRDRVAVRGFRVAQRAGPRIVVLRLVAAL